MLTIFFVSSKQKCESFEVGSPIKMSPFGYEYLLDGFRVIDYHTPRWSQFHRKYIAIFACQFGKCCISNLKFIDIKEWNCRYLLNVRG